MTKAELENKHIAELHSLAAAAGIERYRMLPRAELIAKLADGDPGPSRQPAQSPGSGAGQRQRPQGEQRDRPPRRRRRSGARPGSGEGRPQGSGREPRSAPERSPERQPAPEPGPAAPEPSPPSPASAASSPRPRRRRRRRFGRRGKQGVTLQDLLLPPSAGRQALLCAETREGCTALLRGIAADLSGDSKGPDPVALLIDPSPEELADWRRDAPQAEIVAAGQPRHASDALAQATARASAGDDVILLVDSLTRLGEAYEDADAAKQFFDAGRTQSGTGTLTVVAALERPA
jgi:Rho termination factor, N-terminal domain